MQIKLPYDDEIMDSHSTFKNGCVQVSSCNTLNKKLCTITFLLVIFVSTSHSITSLQIKNTAVHNLFRRYNSCGKESSGIKLF